MRVPIVLSFVLGAALATLNDDNVGLLQQKVSVHDFGKQGTGKESRLKQIPEWFPTTDECYVEYCQTWKDLREHFCCGFLPKENGYCTEDPANPNICEASNTMAVRCAVHLFEHLDDDLDRLGLHRRQLYSHKCGGYKVAVSSSCSQCGDFAAVTMEEGIKAWSDREYYRYRYVPQVLIGSTMFRGCHKCHPVGTVFTMHDVPPGRTVCAWGERAHLYRHGKFPKTLPEQGWTQVANESMIWEFSPTRQIAVDIFCKKIIEGGTIKLPATEGHDEFVGGYALEAECDWQCYMERYPNIATTVNHEVARAKQHWELYGKFEGRICTCPPADCNWDWYLERYADAAAVVRSFLDHCQNILESWLGHLVTIFSPFWIPVGIISESSWGLS